jgi:DNA-binding NarL/FixJ family response regulator
LKPGRRALRRRGPALLGCGLRRRASAGCDRATPASTSGSTEVKVVVLTTFEHDDYIFDALNAGASGFLLKRTKPEELIGAIHTVADGDSLLSPSVPVV